ncbi:hypothetical protein H1R20_g13313, partial [Candolleomyces eurysporus]
MSSVKEKHYWSQLRSALTAGQWLAPFPAKEVNAKPLSWDNLFRKFNKHCKGFNDVSELASHNYDLALLLASSSLNEDEDYADVRDFSVELGNESVLPSERIQEALKGYETLKALQTANSDSVSFALAYYAYALGRPSDCLSHLAKVPDFSQIQAFVPKTGTASSSTSNLLTIPTSTAPASASSSVTGGFSSYIDSSVAEVRDGRGWALTETFRSLCLQGMSHEKLDPENPKKALRAYVAALPAFRVLQSSDFTSLISTPARLPSGKLDYSPFTQLRELWRWVERLLWRAICLSSRTSNIHISQDDATGEEDSLWMWLDKYTICSASWPPTFRTEHRSTISSIYLRALVLRHGIPKGPSSSMPISEKTPIWLHTARSVVQDYRAILNVSTKFPKAGERNVKVEEFVDLCVAVWEASGARGEHANWVLDILWWATRLTFNSSRVFRHLTRLLYLSGDASLAKRCLRLYIQVVSKAWQASKQGAGDSVNPNDNDSLVNDQHDGYLEDTDTDINWLETLVFGAKMLCKTASAAPGSQELDDVKEAITVLGKAKERMKFAEVMDPDTEAECQRLRAEFALAEGIADGVLAVKGQDPLARPSLLESSHQHLLESISIDPTPSAHFHLALSYARDSPHRDLDQAIQHAGIAAQGNSRDIHYWHLLGLLLSSVEKWEEADTILAHAADLDFFADPDSDTQEPKFPQTPVETSGGSNADDGTTVDGGGKELTGSIRTRRQSKHFALNIAINGDGNNNNGGLTRTFTSETVTPIQIDHVGALNASVLSSDATFVPPSAQLLRSILDPVPPSRQDLFEWGLQLRMTQMALVEVRQGPEGAEEGWLEVFSWVAEKKGTGPSAAPTEDPHLKSVSEPRRSLDIDPRNISSVSISALHATTVQMQTTGDSFVRVDTLEVSTSSVVSNGDADGLPPITISPASPDASSFNQEEIVNGDRRSSSEKKGALGALGRSRRSSSLERSEKDNKEKGGDTSKSKKMQQMLKNRVKESVRESQLRISAVGRKIGHGVTRNGSLRRSSSTPDFHAVLQQTSYQASSIHSRRRISSIIHSQSGTPTESITPPPPPPAPSPGPQTGFGTATAVPTPRAIRENRLLSDLWLMSAATFRRLGKIDEAKGAIQQGEVKDEHNPNVWVQLALYYNALGHTQHAISTLQKALFIDPDDVSATVHLARLYLTPPPSSPTSPNASECTSPDSSSPANRPSQSDIDLACGLLTALSRGRGWDVPEVWYYLGTAYRLQGRAEKEGEALERALRLSEARGVREVGAAIGSYI